MKRVTLLLIVTMLLISLVASAGPFADVPFAHWAYDAIDKLTEKDLLQGYPDGTFKGNQPLTRYGFAMVTVKILANIEQMLNSGLDANLVTREDMSLLNRMMQEFADELTLLGIKVTRLQDDMRVALAETQSLKRDMAGIKDYVEMGGMEKVKLSGDMMVRHMNILRSEDNFNDNSMTDMELRLRFTAHIDTNITAVARWRLRSRHAPRANDNTAAAMPTRRPGSFGVGGIGAPAQADNILDTAFLEIKDMFAFGGDFKFGRSFYMHGHGMLINNYLDVVRYYKRSGDFDVVLKAIYDRHIPTYKYATAVDSRPIWNLKLGTKKNDHDLYLNLYAQEDSDLSNRNPFLPAFNMSDNVPGEQLSDERRDVELGSRGSIDANGNWNYDLGMVYTTYDMKVVNDATTAPNPFINPSLSSLSAHGAVKWDSKREWAAKVAYTTSDDESVGAYTISNDLRYLDEPESPTEDIGRGNSWFDAGLLNMSNIKAQVEYRPRNTKHYFRIAGDYITENNNFVSNDLAKYAYNTDPLNTTGHNAAGVNSSDIPAGASKDNTVYDRWNNFTTADAKATVLTFEYRYQLAEMSRIRVGYTMFEFSGDERRATPAQTRRSAGRGKANDFDYRMFWMELHNRF